MSKIDELIKQHCPNGVEYKDLGDIVNILDNQRKPVSKDKRVQGNIPYFGANGIQDWVNDYIFDGTFLLVGEDGSVINKDNTPVLNWATGKIWVNNHAHILSEKKEKAVLRYIFFSLSKTDISAKVRGIPPKLNQQNLRSIKIPVPPIPVQEEIVRILDTFSSLEAELEAELEARKKQYEYYRNKLLTFDENTTGGGINWKMLSEVCDIYTGGEVPEDSIKGDIPDDTHIYPIYGNGKEIYGYSSSYRIDKDAVCISSIGANTGAVFFYKKNFTPIIRLKVLVPKNDNLNIRYLYHIATTLNFVSKNNGGIPNMNANDVKKHIIPVPPLEEQKRIVSILDKFDALVNDISEGLPAELNARKQQYEYYRNKLLTFSPLESEMN